MARRRSLFSLNGLISSRRKTPTASGRASNRRKSRWFSRSTVYSGSKLSSDRAGVFGIYSNLVDFKKLDNLVENEEMAAAILRRITEDPFKEGFRIQSADQEFVEEVLFKLDELRWEESARKTWRWGALYGYSPLMKVYNDKTMRGRTTMERPPSKGAKLTGFMPVSPRVVSTLVQADDVKSKDFGSVIAFEMKLKDLESIRVHKDRFSMFVHESPTGDPRGLSIFAPVFEALMFKKNSDAALAETLVRNAMKIAVLTMPSDVDDEEKDNMEEEFVSVRAKDRLALRGDDLNITEFGGSGTLDPEPYTKYNLQNICAGVGIPKSVIFDIDRPSDVGNDQNLKNYYSLVKRIQRTVLEVHLRETIDELVNRRQLRAAEYKIEWLPFEEVSFGERSQAVMRENLGLEKMMGAFERAKELGFKIPTDEYTWSLTPYGAMKLVKKPELSPEHFYGEDFEENIMTAVGNNDILPIDTATTILNTAIGKEIYGEAFYEKHIYICNNRLATLIRTPFFNDINKEQGVRSPDMARNINTAKVLIAEVRGNEQKYISFVSTVENYAAAGIEKFRVRGSCPTCKAQNRYGVYPVLNVARLPQFPLHGKKCVFTVHPY